MRVIIDTNIFISGMLSPNGAPARIVDAVFSGQLTAVCSAVTFNELREVLLRPRLRKYFEHRNHNVNAFLDSLQELVEIIDPVPCNDHIRDPKDRPFIELATTLPKPEFLITGDKDFTADRYAGVKVISASNFMHYLNNPY